MSASEAPAANQRFIREVGVEAELVALVEPVLQDLGFRLVRIKVSGRDGKTVQIMAERPDGGINIDECEQISRQLSPLLDVNDIVDGAYRLEVSSPGIDRPLVRPSDFEDWAGHEAKIELQQPIDRQKKFRGELEGYEDGEIRLKVNLKETGEVVIGIPIAFVSDAHLVLTDELIRAALARAKTKGNAPAGDGSEPDGFQVEEN